MCDYLEILNRKEQFFNVLDERIRAADENREKEVKAASSIQRVQRGAVLRSLITKKNYHANEIQRVFRGRMGRKKAKREADAKKTLRQLYYINYLCIQLQKCFRGYYSRKYKRDHSKRKAYCRELQEKGKEILEKMQQYAFEQNEREAEEARQQKENEFKHLAQNLHHLLSTKHVRGVYNPLAHLVLQPTMNQKPVEEHIRGVVKDLLRTRGITKRGLVEDINGTLKIPLKGQKYRLSLQASVPYDTVRKEQLREKLLHKILTREKGDFLAGGKTKLIDNNEIPLSMGDPYMDPWANPMLVKGVPQDQKQLLESSWTRKALFAKAPEKPYVTAVGGNRSSTMPNDVFDIIAEAEETGGSIHRHRGLKTARFGLSASMDARSTNPLPPSSLTASKLPNGYTQPTDIPRSSASLRSTQRRVKSYGNLTGSRPQSINTTANYLISQSSKVPFEGIAEGHDESSILSNGSPGQYFEHQQDGGEGNHGGDLSSSDEEDDFRG